MSFTKEGADRISKAMQDHVKEHGNPFAEQAQPEPVVQDAQTEHEQPEEEVKETTQEQPENEDVQKEQVQEQPKESDEENGQEKVQEQDGQEEAVEESEVPTFNFGEKVEEEVNVDELREYVSKLKEENEQLKQSQESVFANEQARAINEYLRNGGEFNEAFFKSQTINTDIDYNNKQSMIEALKNKYTLLDGYSEQDASLLIERNYEALFDEESFDEKEIKYALLDLKSAAKDIQPKLQEFKKKSSLPTVDPKDVERQQEQFRKYQLDVSQELGNVKSFDFELKDDMPIKIEVDKNSHQYISSLLLEPENLQKYFQENYLTEDGTTDVGKFARDQFIRLHFDKLLRTAYAQGESAGQKGFAQRELRQENPSGGKKRADNKGQSEGWTETAKRNFAQQARQLIR